ncbi:MAG: hypothetical protein K2L93_03575 [Muribaculaceae bacterium]|nr:hypothetical protein [Muribaculaceae bacterium]
MEAPTLLTLLNWTILVALTSSAAWLGSKMQRCRLRMSLQRANRHNQ